MENFIEEKCREAQINQNHIKEMSNKIEMLDNEEELYRWVDELLKKQESEKDGADEDEDKKS